MAVVAQLVEPRIVIPVVEGSNPFSRPIIDQIREARNAEKCYGLFAF